MAERLVTRLPKRERLIRAMNPPGKRAHSPETQELTLLLHDLSVSMPDGWSMGYGIADDLPYPDGGSNLDTFAQEQRTFWEREFRLRGDDDAADNLAAMPADGHHILISLDHEETGAHVLTWIPRDQCAAIVRQPNRTPKQKLAAMRAHVDAALVEGEARKQQRLKKAGR